MTDHIMVLVVDDEPNLCAITKEFLEISKDIEVDAVCSVSDAFNALDSKKYDAIVSDYQMPGKDGLTFLSSLRMKGDTVPFILFTGKGREEVVIDALNLGADSYLQKGGEATPQYAELENRIRNLVQRNRAVEALQESENEFRFLFEGSPDAAFIVDTDGVVIKCNRSSELMLRIPNGEIVGRSLVDFNIFNAKDMSAFQMNARTGSGIDLPPITHQIHRSDGSVIWVESRISRVMRSDKFHAVQIIARDITDLRKAEERLEEMFEQMRLKLSRVLSPDYEIEDGELSNIIDIHEIQLMMEKFYKLTGMVFAILDLNGNVLVANGWQDICTKFHRVNPESRKNCTQSDLHLAHELEPEEYRAYHCMNGMWDIVTPLYIGTKHWGNLYSGQFFFDDEVVDEKYFIAQAEKYGFDKDEYLAALKRVPRVNRDRVTQVMQFYSKLANIISHLSYSNLKLAKILTDYEGTESALRCSEEKYRTYIQYSPMVFFVIDDASNCLDTNYATCEMLGRSSQEIIGLNIMDITAVEDRPTFEQNRLSMLDITPSPSDIRLVRKDGSFVPVLLNMVRLPSGSTMVFGIDIREKKLVENALRESETRIHALVQAIPDLVWLKDGSGIYLYCNALFEQFFGATEASIIGKTDYDFVDRELADSFRKNDLKAIEKGEPTKNEEWITYQSDGHRVQLETTKTPIYNDNGSLIGVLGLGHDITDRRQTEHALREANRKLNILSTMTRHDINNQLMVIAGNLTLLAKKGSNESFDEHYRKITDSVDRISAMIQFTKVYEDIGVKTPVWHDMNELIDMVSKDHRAEKVRIVNDIPNEVKVFADPLIVNVVDNLIDNAIKHGEQTTVIRFYIEPSERGYSIICEDDGKGIPPEMKEKLFTRGFGKCHGLGLFLSKEILAITGITIEEQGEQGQGAKFVMFVEPAAIRTN